MAPPSGEATAIRHVAIIMDGNRRWAERRGLPTLAGHEAGAEAVRRTLRACRELGIHHLTLYAFSMENWRRPKTEVAGLMRLLRDFLGKNLSQLMEEDVRLRVIGRIHLLPMGTRKVVDHAVHKTARNRSGTLVLAISYGGRAEIVDAARQLAGEAVSGKIRPADIDEAMFGRHLYAPDIPDPDLLIRTSGEFRLSNFLLWQVSYAEMVVTETLWPDFSAADLAQAIREYGQRQRRFGGR